jgi:hypothetical protein
MTYPRSITLLLVALCLALTTMGCDSGGDDGAASFENRFDLEIAPTGTANAVDAKQTAVTTLDGFSFFVDATDPETGENIFAIYFTGQDQFGQQAAQDGLFGLVLRNGSRPAAGTYNFASTDAPNAFEDDFAMILFEDVGNFSGTTSTPYTYYVSTGGTMTLDRSDADRVTGSLSVQATRLTFDPQDPAGVTETSVTVTGTFDSDDANEVIGQGFTGI